MRHFPLLSSFLFVGFFCGYFISCSDNRDKDVQIPYPQPLPDSMAILFLPGIVSTDSTDFNAAFSPDGKAVYFTRSENKKLIIYCSHYEGEHWGAAQPVSFNDPEYSSADPAFAPDGKLYFISNKPRDTTDTLSDYDIWFVVPLNGGAWSEPVNATIVNSDSNEFYVSFARNGNLYFASSRAGGYGAEDVYVSKKIEGEYGLPMNLGPSINTEKTEYDPGVSPEEDKLVFSSRRDDAIGGADLYYAIRSGDEQWHPALHLSTVFNTNGRDYCAYFSPDSKYFFFSSEKDVKWISARMVGN